MKVAVKNKAPMPKHIIFKIMLTVNFAVGAIFLLKNLLGKAIGASIAVAVSMLALTQEQEDDEE